MLRRGIFTVVLAVLSLPAQGQSFGDGWAGFEPAPGLLAASGVSSPTTEVDFTAGDLDADGDDDLIVVRKEPYTKPGARTNLLLMNVNGVLVDRSAQWAAASDVAGDSGFLTPTTDRDVQIADLDQDGWLDVVTCTALMDGKPKALSHPRVYRNLGSGAGGWLGLSYEEARIPQLVTLGGLPVAPHATAVLVGDVTGDGAPDLYLVDHDSGFDGYDEPAAWDLEDRLLINDGAGYFTDETVLRMQSLMYVGGFGVGGLIGDYNLDGKNDVMRASTGSLSDPVQEVSLSYNNPAAEGTFNIYQEVYQLSPYAVASGDLNQDGRLDVVAGDQNQDRYLLNTGVDPLGRVIWSPALLFDFLTADDDGFTGQILVHDLDHDGSPEVLIADEDVDIATTPAYRLHVYHNLGGAPGAYVMLREERQSSAASSWIGAEGLHDADLLRTYDMAALDIDGDGFDELVLGRVDGTSVWRNTTGERVCQPDLGFAGPGSARLSFCGDTLTSGQSADLVVSHASPLAPGVIAYGFAETALPFAGGTLVVVPAGLLPFTADHGGKRVLPDVISSGGPLTITLQAVLIDPGQPFGFAITNAVRAELLP
jgi:hypothetical protein